MTTQNPSLGSSILVFTGAFILLAVIVNVALWVLVTYAGVSSESGGALGWMPPIIGAMMAGQHYGKRVGAKPPQSHSWAAGFAFAIITMAFMALSFYIVFAAMSGPSDISLQGLLDEMGTNLFFGIVAGFFLLFWVMQRFAFSFGAGQAVKMAAIQAARQKG